MIQISNRRICQVTWAASLLLALSGRGRAQEPTPPAPERTIKVFQLANARAGQLVEVLESVVQEGRLAVDERTNSILLSGDAETARIAEALIEKLDSQETKREASPAQADRPRSLQVRLIWLVSGLQDERAPPAKDLEPVLKELSALGIEGLRVVSNALVNIRSDEFSLQGTPMVGRPVRLEAQGNCEWTANEPQPTVRLVIRVQGTTPDSQRPAPRQSDLVSLSTTIDAPFGQFVVLGAAPMGEMTSVFVLQIVPK